MAKMKFSPVAQALSGCCKHFRGTVQAGDVKTVLPERGKKYAGPATYFQQFLAAPGPTSHQAGQKLSFLRVGKSSRPAFKPRFIAFNSFCVPGHSVSLCELRLLRLKLRYCDTSARQGNAAPSLLG